MLSNNAVGRISVDGNEAKAIKARKAVPPACPTVAYRSATMKKGIVSIAIEASRFWLQQISMLDTYSICGWRSFHTTGEGKYSFQWLGDRKKPILQARFAQMT
jgi:hypothetical protein